MKFIPGSYGLSDASVKNDEEVLDHKLYLIASKNLPVGHVAIAGESSSGEIIAKGFYPKEKSIDIGNIGIEGFVLGTVKNDIELFREAQAGADGVKMQMLNVTKAQHDRAIQYMSDYADKNLYNLYRNSCVTAALNSFNAAGVSNFKTNMFGALPHSVYKAMELNIPIPKP